MKEYYFTDKEDPLPKRVLLVLLGVLILVLFSYANSTKVVRAVGDEDSSISDTGSCDGYHTGRDSGGRRENEGGEGITGVVEADEVKQIEDESSDIAEEVSIEITPEEQASIERFAEISKSRNQELIQEIEEVIVIGKKYGFEPKILLAMIAEESGWGGSYLCVHKRQCLGYGELDSGSMGFHYDGLTYAEAFEDVLSRASERYSNKSIEEISWSGWNTRSSWRENVNLIYNQL